MALACVALCAKASAQHADLADLLVAYRTQDADAAVRTLASWSAAEISRADARIGPNDSWNQLALGLLMLEAERASPSASAVIELRSRGVQTIAEVCTAKPPDARLSAPCREALRLVVEDPGREVDLDQRVIEAMPNDAELLLAIGAFHEYWMLYVESDNRRTYSKVGEDPWSANRPTIVTSHGRIGAFEASHAESALRQTLAVNPGLAEARVRLGRVQWLLDRVPEAESLWRTVMSDRSSDPRMIYLAGLFLGQLYEQRRDVTAAERAYREALVSYPGGASVRAALARLLLASGRDAEGWTILNAALGDAFGGARAPDPWILYPRGELWWRADQALGQLRQVVRK